MKRLKCLIRKFNDINIMNKLLISYMLVVFLPVMIVGLKLTGGLRQQSLTQATNEATVNVERIKRRITDIIRIPTDISNKIYLDKKLGEIMTKNYESTWDVVRTYWDYPDLIDYIRLYKEIRNIRLYTTNQSLLDNWSFFKIEKNSMMLPWFREALDCRGKILWDYVPDETAKNEYFLSLIRAVKDSSTYNSIGVLVININKEYFNSILKQEPFETMIVSDKGLVVAAKNDNIIGKTLDELKISKSLLKIEKGNMQMEYGGRDSKVIVNNLKLEGSSSTLKIVSVFPIETIVKDANRMSVLGLTVIVISLFVSLVLIYIFSKAISSRVRRLSAEMHKVALGNFSVYTTIEGEDEIGHLFRDLNMMVKSIEKLMREINEANLQKNQLIIKQKEIKLKMLANQINPHFLFNALETIRMKAHCKGENEIAEVVKLLGKLMRKNLEVENELVTVNSEIELVRSYLEIQRFRFGEKVNYNIEMDDTAGSYKILPLIIQPIVENAVVHGIEDKEESGTIDISIKELDGKLIILVVDNGNGMDEERLKFVLDSLNDTEDEAGRRVGLKNVHQRIRLYYGAGYGIELSSRPEAGTRVRVLLPVGG